MPHTVKESFFYYVLYCRYFVDVYEELCMWIDYWMFAAVKVELRAEFKNASTNTVILDDSAFFHWDTGSDKLHHAPQTSWYVYKWRTPVCEVEDLPSDSTEKSFRWWIVMNP